MFWCGWCFGAVKVLMLSMFWCSQCFAPVDVIGQCFGVVNALVWLIFWCGWCFGVHEALVWLIFWCAWCFGVIDVLVRLRYWHSQYLRSLRKCRILTQLMFQHGQCFGTFKFWGPSENVKAQGFINEGNEHLTSLQSPNFSRSVLNTFNMKHLPYFYNIKKKIWPMNYIFC